MIGTDVMTDPVFITPDPPLNKGLDYAWLKEEGTRLIQELSGAIWTDYNEHDPGVTTLEQLCYALTELSYRAEIPLQTLLVDPKTGRIDTRRQALFVPRRIMPAAPQTQNDYRKLIVDRVPGVANVWMIPRRTNSPEAVNGLYDIAVYAPDADPCGCDDRDHFRPEVIRERVRRVYCAHRCLCEDLHDVRLLEPLRAVVHGAAVIDNSLAAETIMARLLFNLGNFLAPELRRQPLEALIAAGLDAATIFDGPLLRHGFVADDTLAPKPKVIILSEVIRVMARTPGVRSVRKVTLRIGDDVVPPPPSLPSPPIPSIPIPHDRIPQLHTRPVDGDFPIRLWRNGIEVKPDPVRVERELDGLWNNYRRTYPLARQYQEYFAVPQGQYRNVETYYSIQNQYPNVYGINSFGVPESDGAVRIAQAKQLKGYLLAFEQLLADFFAQLANVRKLYATDEARSPTYFYQYLDRSVPNVRRLRLLRPGYREGLARIVQEDDPAEERRNRFLDLLLALYAERLDAEQMPLLSDGRDAGERLIRAKLELLRHLVVATRDRGTGFDYQAAPSPRNIAGMAIRSRIELGMPAFPRRALSERLEELGLSLSEDEEQLTIGGGLPAHGDHIEQTFTPLDTLRDERQGISPGAAPNDPALNEHAAALLRGHRTSGTFLRGLAGGDVRLGTLPGDTMIAAACRTPSEPEWRLVGRYADRERALAVLTLLIALAEELTGTFEQLHIVEHTLLRFGRWREREDPDDEQGLDAASPMAGEPNRKDDDSFVYSFTITAVVSAPRHAAEETGYRAAVAEVIRRNAPAHVAVDYCFLRPHRMTHFETRYDAWRRALRRGDRHHIRATSRRLRHFLEHEQHRKQETSAAANSFDRSED
ncbi:MAG: hypothetical protein JWN71_2964 [Xanthobacteraceae bacterium]|nr:hypothetical protein [Xanthobacteraceae bacterium]